MHRRRSQYVVRWKKRWMSVIRMNFPYLSTSGEDLSGIERSIEWGEAPEAPFAAGTQVGTIIYTLGEKKIGQMPIVTKTEPKKQGISSG
ncbi:MAG: hypothetical protein ACLTSZ_03715 [Lachnospiraceae bacterium]